MNIVIRRLNIGKTVSVNALLQVHYCLLKELQQGVMNSPQLFRIQCFFSLDRQKNDLRLTFEPLNKHLLQPRYRAATFRRITDSKVEHTLYDFKDDIPITDDVIGQNVIIRKYSLRRRF